MLITDDIKSKYGKKSSKKSTDKNGLDNKSHNKGDVEYNSSRSIVKSKKRKHLEKIERIEKASSSSPLRTDITTQKVNKLIIKNDTEDEEELRREVERSTTPSKRTKRSNVSPIKFDITDDESPSNRPLSATHKRRKSTDEFDGRDEKLGLKRTPSTRKYDDLPPCKCAYLAYTLAISEPQPN